jgi:hypothetical protein
MHKTSIIIFIVLTLSLSVKMEAALQWDIYNDAVIDEVGDFYNRIRIYDTPPNHTTAIMVGGRVDVMNVYDASTLCMTGGNVSSLGAFDSSTVNISGGAQLTKAGCNGWSTVNISGGSLGGANVSDYATLNMSGGYVDWAVDVSDCGTMNMTGGGIGHLHVYDTAVVNLHGGRISSGILETGPVHFNGTINIYGYSLVKESSGNGGRVYGFYFDGSPFSINLEEELYSQVNLIPEPTTILLFGLGGLFVKVCRK